MSSKNAPVKPEIVDDSMPDGLRPGPRLAQPVGSRVVVSKGAQGLHLHLPKLGFLGPGTRVETFIWLIWTAHIGMFTHVMLTNDRASLLRLIIMLPFWGVSLFLASRAVFGMFGHTTVELRSTEVAVVRRLARWRFRRWAPARHWLGASVEHRGTRQRLTVCIMRVGVQELEFGHRLSRAEQEWAVGVCNDWMGQGFEVRP